MERVCAQVAVAVGRARGWWCVRAAAAVAARATVRQTSRAAEILIEDEGPGIPESDLEKVFDPFTRLETSRSRETGGIGLGLPIARSILRAHGGDVTLSNRPDGGLRATVRIPSA